MYEEDKEILKQMNGTIAQAINTLLHGKQEQYRAILESYAENYFNPKIEQIRKKLTDQISEEIDRRFKELKNN